MKTIKIKNKLTVILDNGLVLSKKCDADFLKEIEEAVKDDDIEKVKSLMVPGMKKVEKDIQEKIDFSDNIKKSNILELSGSSVYFKDVSELSLPTDLAMAIYQAEKNGDEELIQTYKNFWTLTSLNPDSRARINLFWFLTKYGMTISKTGLFVAYRNVELKSEGIEINSKEAIKISKYYNKVKNKYKKSPSKYFVGYKKDRKKLSLVASEKKLVYSLGTVKDAYKRLSEKIAPVYTDAHSHTFKIQIGKIVSMDRQSCDPDHNNTCSRGLHVAGKSWLSAGDFGKITIKVLVNPADVVAVPPQDNYGKMRTCAYYPIEIIERDENGSIIDKEIKNGFEDDFINLITYQGKTGQEQTPAYKLEIPDIPEISRINIMDKLNDIKELLSNKVVD